MRATIVRIDARLVHGQIVELWLPASGATAVLVVDDRSAKSELAQGAMRLALPEEIELEVRPVDDPAPQLLGNDAPTLVLVSSVASAARVVRALQLRAVPLNVGLVPQSEARRRIATGVNLDEDEVETLATLVAEGMSVEVRGLPDQPPLDLDRVRAAFERG